MTVDRMPSRYSSGFVCAWCNAHAGQEWKALGYKVEYGDGSEGFSHLESLSEEERYSVRVGGYDPGPERVVTGQWASSRCFACAEVAVWNDNEIVFPAGASAGIPEHHVDMPKAVAALYDEARAVTPVSPRAGAALARATLEALLKFLDPDAPKEFKNLDGRIARLQKDVSSSSWKLLTVLRHAGNKSVHVEESPDAVTALILDPNDISTLSVLFEAINRLVDERITQERVADALLDALPPEVTHGAMRKSDAAMQHPASN